MIWWTRFFFHICHTRLVSNGCGDCHVASYLHFVVFTMSFNFVIICCSVCSDQIRREKDKSTETSGIYETHHLNENSTGSALKYKNHTSMCVLSAYVHWTMLQRMIFSPWCFVSALIGLMYRNDNIIFIVE